MEDRSNEILIVAVFFAVTSWVSVALRVYVRKCVIASFGYDDLTMLLTQVFFTAYLACQIGGVAYGSGKPRSAITDENAQIALRYWWLCEVFYSVATSLLKISLGFFLLRVAVNKYHIWTTHIIMITSGVFGVGYCFVIIFQCRPVSYWWNLEPNATGKCFDRPIFAYTAYAISALNSLADWTFGGVLPILIVKDLQMKLSAKVIIAGVLGFGAIGSAATIIRMPYIDTIVGYKDEFLWRSSDVAIWTTVEVGIGVTAGCMATLKPLLKSFLQLIGKHTTTTGRTGTIRTAGNWNGELHHNSHAFSPIGDASRTTTIITGRKRGSIELLDWAERDSSVENMILEDCSDIKSAETGAWNSGITKRVEIETTEKRSLGENQGISEYIHEERDVEMGLPKNPTVVYERL